MELEFKNVELLNIFNSMIEFMQIEFPIDHIGWNLKKNMKNIESALKLFGECEQELVSKYAVKDENGNIKYDDKGQPEIYPAKRKEYIKEHSELLNCKNTVNINRIKLSVLMDYCKEKGINIKPSLLFDLDFMIEDDLQ